MVPMRSLMTPHRALEARGEEEPMLQPREVPRQFRRTKLCRFFATGGCRYEDQCTFAHTRKELEDLPDLKKTSICKPWLSGCCNLSADECTYAHGKEDLRRMPVGQRKTKHGKKAPRHKETHDASDDSTSCGESQGCQTPFMHMDSRGSFSSVCSQPLTAQEEPDMASPLLWDPLGMAAEKDTGCLERSLGWSNTLLKQQRRRVKKPTQHNQKVEEEMALFQSCPLPVIVSVMSQQCYDGSVPFSPYAESVVLMPVMGYTSSSNMELEDMLKQAMPEHYED
eukprot:TRINITY_DN875_c0_g2_i1.p1 TRINITY_DN875_c0_g2~~TRINITY_DN875_c0_g2_i1.p1  ORF type:complete len:281 (-),score=57.28 TRINITY_DN875_c0_g2_i1:116-958(-)